MGRQLSVPGAECPNHDARFVCDECPERFDTDHTGFVHRLELNGRLPMRRCAGCSQMVTPGGWNHGDWFRCLVCVPLGTKAPPP